MKILIVDDMPTVQKLMKLQLGKLGFTDTAAASNGADAWKLIESAAPPFDLILSDWNMPVCTGLELLQRVRSTNATKDIPFFLVSAEGEKHNIVSAKEAGVTDYIMKPLTMEIMSEKIGKYLKK